MKRRTFFQSLVALVVGLKFAPIEAASVPTATIGQTVDIVVGGERFGGMITVVAQLDGKEIARQIVPLIPGVMEYQLLPPVPGKRYTRVEVDLSYDMSKICSQFNCLPSEAVTTLKSHG